MKKVAGFLFYLFTLPMCWCQPGPATLQNGYAQRGDTTCFIFSEDAYGLKGAIEIAATGAFRNRGQDMNDAGWNLKRTTSGNRELKIYNPGYETIRPGTSFKYRAKLSPDRVAWLDPPAGADNIKSGNLIFMKGTPTPALTATLLSNDTIVVTVTGVSPTAWNAIKATDFIVTDATGKQHALSGLVNEYTTPVNDKLEAAEPESAGESLVKLVVKQPLDKRRVYYVDIPELKLRARCTFDAWFGQLKSDKELGANISADGNNTVFRVFAPRATAVKLYLYKADPITHHSTNLPYDSMALSIDNQGVWEITVKQNLEGTWYDFTVHGLDDPGNFFYETHPVHVSDPYARVSDDSFGKCMVAARTRPASPLKNGRPRLEQVMAYEVHVQDFTDLLPVNDNLKGTLPAMTVSGLKNSRGAAIGFDYLTDLGINTVHLMPVQEMLHWPKDEWEKEFKDDAYMKEQGIATENYDWGYRTSHSFAIETRYRQRGTLPGDERRQLRDVVQKFHNNNMAVVVDVVFNHTAENIDGRNYLFHFNAFDKQYYYRTKNGEHIGEYGNETKSENRYMVQRWIIDQCRQLVDEFGVDGFRIDLAGQTDKQTLLALKAALPADIIIYGEPWIDSNDPAYNDNPNWHWYKADAPICYFNDDTRNAYKGPVFELHNKDTDRGWPGGNTLQRSDVKLGLTCKFPTQKNINSAINYLDIHDNFALADQFATHDFDGRFGVDEHPYKIAATLLFCTPGPLVIHGGTEMMRSKGMAPLKEVSRETPSGRIWFHGKRDTYNMRNANHFVWENVGNAGRHMKASEKSQPYENADYRNMVDYWKGLIEFRKRYLLNTDAFKAGKLDPTLAFVFIEPLNKHVLGYIINGNVLVLLNTSGQAHEVSFSMPRGKWKKIANASSIVLNPKFGEAYTFMNGGDKKLSIEGTGIAIWVKE